MTLTIEVFKQNLNFVAKCKELDIYSYGNTSDCAIKRLKKIISFYVQSVSEYVDENTNELKDLMTVDDKYIN